MRRWPSVGRREHEPSPRPSPAKGEGSIPLAVLRNCRAQRRSTDLPASHGNRASDDAGQNVPLLGIAGRMGVVRAESERADAAFELLLWLTDSQWASQVFAASPATTLFRRSQVASPKAWVESNVSATAARQYAEQTAETLHAQARNSSRRSACPAGPTIWRLSMKPCRRPSAASKRRPRH